ncbi:hypothetical protein [[Bacillus] enclensis]|jgi:hypothetical protein|uniref:hypothetical protein n=1 Tax=[Bacillus] enclensis TaxID=1402860 RepID=UPI000509D84B|nr:hypothetical protein [[Bacillus] enclensis]MBH9968074.1 hypothetical protein [[Bacillus] enclensis]
MKKDDLKKLFDHVDENEKTSVEFQTVWRKAHRKSWKQKLIQSAGPNLAILLILLVLTPITGYYIVNQSVTSSSAPSVAVHPPETEYVISGKVYNFPNQIVVKGRSNLPEGTIISLKYSKKDKATNLYVEKGVADQEGSFRITGDRLERKEDYIVNIIVYPHIQRDSIKEMLGSKGQYLTKSSDGFTYAHEGESYTGLQILGQVNKSGSNSQSVLSEPLVPLEEFELMH